jgi:peptidoglycan/LPS O-acetylase OafA/YrhL
MNCSSLPVDLAGRIPELDGLRGVAISMVVILHYLLVTWQVRPGTPVAYALATGRLAWTGVDLFFVLSGFLIGGILADARGSTNYFSVFYTRRFFRIFPIYAALLLGFSVLEILTRTGRFGDFSWLTRDPAPWYSYWTFTQNFSALLKNPPYARYFIVMWSLAVEEQFYLVAPLAIRLINGKNLAKRLVAGILCVPLIRTVFVLCWPRAAGATAVLLPCRADALLMGVLAAVLLRDAKWFRRIARADSWFAVSLPILILGMGILTVVVKSYSSALLVTVGYSWIAFFYATVLVFAITRRNSLLSLLLRNRVLMWLGAISYGLYLLHQPIAGLVFCGLRGHPPDIARWYDLFFSFLSLVATVIVARLSWLYFERPLVQLGHRARYKYSASDVDPAVSLSTEQVGRMSHSQI